MIINSESYHGVDEEPLEETAGGAVRPDTDRWQSAQGPEQEISGSQKRSIMFRTMTLNSMAATDFSD